MSCVLVTYGNDHTGRPLLGGRAASFGSDGGPLGLGHVCLGRPPRFCRGSSASWRADAAAGSRAGVRQGVQHHVALVHVALEGQGEAQGRLQHHLVLVGQRRVRGRDAGVFRPRGGRRVAGLRRVQHLDQRRSVQAAAARLVFDVRACWLRQRDDGRETSAGGSEQTLEDFKLRETLRKKMLICRVLTHFDQWISRTFS